MYIFNWPLPIGAFQGQWNTINEVIEQQQLLRIPTGQRQTGWLFTIAPERKIFPVKKENT